jgi:hypothetical protein
VGGDPGNERFPNRTAGVTDRDDERLPLFQLIRQQHGGGQIAIASPTELGDREWKPDAPPMYCRGPKWSAGRRGFADRRDPPRTWGTVQRGPYCPVGEALLARIGAHIVAPPHQEQQRRRRRTAEARLLLLRGCRSLAPLIILLRFLQTGGVLDVRADFLFDRVGACRSPHNEQTPGIWVALAAWWTTPSTDRPGTTQE